MISGKAHRNRCAWFIVVMLSLLPGCIMKIDHTKVKKIRLDSTHKSPVTATSNDHTITVWVHGTRLFGSSTFEKEFNNQPGLKKASLVGPCKLKTIAQALMNASPECFNPEQFYLFGWDGKLTNAARKQAAEQLYRELKNLSTEYRKTHRVSPCLRLMAHSHGGNVILNLATIDDSENDKLEIDQVILLACPVQESTKKLIHDPRFKQVFSLYSRLDMYQIIDPQGLHPSNPNRFPIFSERTFDHDTKLIQSKIRVNKRGLTHYEFVQQDFLNNLPHIINVLSHWHEQDPHLGAVAKKLLAINTN